MINNFKKGLFLTLLASVLALSSCSKESDKDDETSTSCNATCSNLDTYYDDDLNNACFSWGTNGSNISYYEVQYGEKNFTLGDGVKVIMNDVGYCDGTYEENKIYDFYVRIYCKNNLGYSEWFGPVSRLIDK